MNKENNAQVEDLGLEMQMQPQAEPQVKSYGHFDGAKPYKRADCEAGEITDADEIDELRHNQQIDILQNFMLGDYAVDGEYVLPDEICDELVRAKKVVTNNFENYIFVQTLRPIGEFPHGKFFVTVSKLDKKLMATLTFVEPVHKMNKLVTNAQSCQIASFVDNAGEQFFYDMKKEFNIVDDDYVYPADAPDEFKQCKRRKKHRYLLWKESVAGVERTEKKIFDARMKVLNTNENDYTKSLLDMFSTLLGKRASFFDRALSRSLCMNQLLDECIDVLQGKHLKNEKQVLKDMRTATKPIRLEQEREIEGNKTIVASRIEKEQGKAKVISKKQPVEKKADSFEKPEVKNIDPERIGEISLAGVSIHRRGGEAELGGGTARRNPPQPTSAKDSAPQIIGSDSGKDVGMNR